MVETVALLFSLLNALLTAATFEAKYEIVGTYAPDAQARP